MSLRKQLRSRTGAVLTGAAVLVLVGGVGGAAADRLITSGDIKDHTIRARDIHAGAVGTGLVRDGGLGMRDLNTHTRGKINAPGPRGPRGPAGPAGPAGQDGVSAYDTVPSGKTVYGVVGADFDNQAPAGTADWGTDASLPMRAPAGLTDDDVEVNVESWQGDTDQTQPTSGDTGDTACEGTPDNPTAPPGKVCVYVTGADNAVNVVGYTVAFGSGNSPYGFKVKWDVAGTGDTFVDAVWAYTAP